MQYEGGYEAYLFLGLLNQICYKTKMYNVKCNFYNKERIFNPNPNHLRVKPPRLMHCQLNVSQRILLWLMWLGVLPTNTS